MATQKYNTSYARRTGVERPARYGLRWTTEELENLRRLFKHNPDLEEVCLAMQRPADGILQKLQVLRLIKFDTQTCNFYLNAPKPETTPESEPIMSNIQAPTIEIKTFIAGVDASTMSDKDIFKKIANLEMEAKSWQNITSKPKKLDVVIDNIHKDIAALVAYVDSRE